MERTGESGAASLGLSEVEGTGVLDAASLEGVEVEKVSAGGSGFAGVGLKYFKSASEERRGVYVTTGC